MTSKCTTGCPMADPFRADGPAPMTEARGSDPDVASDSSVTGADAELMERHSRHILLERQTRCILMCIVAPPTSKGGTGMFERFTDRARRVMVLAQEEARMLNHNHI